MDNIEMPKDHDDVYAMMKISRLSEKKLQYLYPELLTYIQDMNWKIAEPTIVLLVKHADAIRAYLPPILAPSHEDQEWKKSVITNLMPRLPKEELGRYLPALFRLAERPTQAEVEAGVDQATIALLKKMEEEG